MAGGLGTAFGLANAASSAMTVGATAVFIATGELPKSPNVTTPETDVAVVAPEVPTPSSPDLPDIVEPSQIDMGEPSIANPAPDSDAPLVAKGPVFDIVRVDPNGTVLVAGKAAPKSRVTLLIDAEQVAEVMSDGAGAFVAFLELQGSGQHQTLSMVEFGPNGPVASAETVLVLLEPDTKQPAKVVVADGEGVKVIQDTANPLPNKAPVAHYDLALDTIAYDDAGEVVLAGRAQGDAHVRIYVDGALVETNPVLKDGNWTVTLGGIEQGIYTLRVDELNAAGKVTARVESPFKREFPEAILAASETPQPALDPQQSRVIIQPGHTLWQLARDTYGSGQQYVQILQANADVIKDPDLIYPGQVFDIPQ